jgi:hypothetical protein
MAIVVHCSCGRRLGVQVEHAGKKVRCPACGTVSPVPFPEPAPAAVPDEPEVPEAEPVEDRAPEELERPREKKRFKKKPRRKSGGFFSGFDFSPERRMSNAGVVLGLVMIVGAIVWFVLGFEAGKIFIYPPILMVVGVIAVVRGILAGKL